MLNKALIILESTVLFACLTVCSALADRQDQAIGGYNRIMPTQSQQVKDLTPQTKLSDKHAPHMFPTVQYKAKTWVLYANRSFLSIAMTTANHQPEGFAVNLKDSSVAHWKPDGTEENYKLSDKKAKPLLKSMIKTVNNGISATPEFPGGILSVLHELLAVNQFLRP